MFFVADIQRQIVLKFQIFQINSFEDIIVGSWSVRSWFASTQAKKVKITWDLDFLRRHMTNHNDYKPY